MEKKESLVFRVISLLLAMSLLEGCLASGKDDFYEGQIKSLDRNKLVNKESAYDKSEEVNDFPKIINIPAEHVIISNNGCKLFNPVPQANETVTWSGKCADGMASGFGALTWYKDGKKGDTDEVFYEKGFRPPGKVLSIVNENGSKCSAALPVFGADKKDLAGKYFKAKFYGGCEKSFRNRIDFYFNEQLYAVYRGDIRRGSLPHGGELILFTGSKYQMGKDNGNAIWHTKAVTDWTNGIKPVKRSYLTGGSKVSVDDLDIGLGLNSDPSNPVGSSLTVVGFSANFLSSKNDVTLSYRIKPNKNADLSNKYKTITINILVTIDYTETSKSWIVAIDHKRQINEEVVLTLNKDKNFSLSGSKKLTELRSFLDSPVATIRISNPKTTLEVLAIEGI